MQVADTNRKIIPVAIWLVALIAILGGCKKAECGCEQDETVLHSNDSLLKDKSFTSERKDWLKRIKQPDLSISGGEAIRLMQISEGTLETIRIEKVRGEYKIVVQNYRTQVTDLRTFSLTPNRNGKPKTFKGSTKLWNELEKMLEEDCFWTKAVITDEDTNATAGSVWSIEARTPYKHPCASDYHHIIYRVGSQSELFNSIRERLKSYAPVKAFAF